MTLEKAAKIQWTLAKIVYVILIPLKLIFVTAEYLNDKMLNAQVALSTFIGRKLLKRTNEYKSGIYKNPKIDEWTAMQVWSLEKDKNAT